MFEFKHHTKALSDAAKNNIAKTEEKYDPDLVFISKDNIKVSTHRYVNFHKLLSLSNFYLFSAPVFGCSVLTSEAFWLQ